jgi:hygromycin-B 7''-O-kinase
VLPPVPAHSTKAELDVWLTRTEQLLAGVHVIARRHGVRGAISRIPEGSMPVFAVGDAAVLKLFAAPHHRWYVAERAFLDRIHGRLGVPTPEILGAGDEDEGWAYVLMSRLHGAPLDRVLPGEPRPAQERAMDALADVVARLHALPTEGLPREDWEAYVERQAAACVEVQRSKGLAESWLAQLPSFLARHRPRPPHRLTIVHSELGPGHVFYEQGAITGVIDFADACVGDPDLELPAVGIFVARGDRALYRRFLGALGRDVAPERALLYTLLHRYANLAWYLREVGAGGAGTLEELAHAWYG